MAEHDRLAALVSYRVLDTAPEPVFDDITRLAAQLFDTPIALVLLDIRMPGMSGLDILRLMRSRPHRPKILMMTAQRDSSTIMQAIEQGAAGYLVKPFKPLDLLKRVDAVLRPTAATAPPPAKPDDAFMLD